MLLANCPVAGCIGVVIAEVYRGQDGLKRHMVETVCTAKHQQISPFAVMESNTATRVLAAIVPSASFPPAKGTWFRAADGVLVGCPGCGQLVRVREPVHLLSGDRLLSQSWTCPTGCGYHQHVVLVDLCAKEVCR